MLSDHGTFPQRPESSSDYDIVISYRAVVPDEDRAAEAYDRLRRLGYRVFFAPRSIPGGRSPASLVFDAIDSAAVTIAIVSARCRTVDGENVQLEWGRAYGSLWCWSLDGTNLPDFLEPGQSFSELDQVVGEVRKHIAPGGRSVLHVERSEAPEGELAMRIGWGGHADSTRSSVSTELANCCLPDRQHPMDDSPTSAFSLGEALAQTIALTDIPLSGRVHVDPQLLAAPWCALSCGGDAAFPAADLEFVVAGMSASPRHAWEPLYELPCFWGAHAHAPSWARTQPLTTTEGAKDWAKGLSSDAGLGPLPDRAIFFIDIEGHEHETLYWIGQSVELSRPLAVILRADFATLRLRSVQAMAASTSVFCHIPIANPQRVAEDAFRAFCEDVVPGLVAFCREYQTRQRGRPWLWPLCYIGVREDAG